MDTQTDAGGAPLEQGVRLADPKRDTTPDELLELAEALQVRRILEEIKDVAALHPAGELPTPFQSAWRLCCEEIFYRATGEQWHMDEDEEKFKRGPDEKLRA